jgi:hypothetical protein
MRLSRVFLFPGSFSMSGRPLPACAAPSAGERLKWGRSGEIAASTFGPPLPVDRPG